MSATTRRITNRTRIALALSGLAPTAFATGSSAATRTAKRSKPITIAVDEFPPSLNNLTSAGNGQWTAMIAGPALARGYKLMPDFSYQPWIFAKDCEVVAQSP